MPPPDDPPPRRTPRTPPPQGFGVPRPSNPDLYEVFAAFLQEYRGELTDGINNRAIIAALGEHHRDIVELLRSTMAALVNISERLARIEAGNNVRDTYAATGTGRHSVVVAPSPSPVPPPPKSAPSVMTKLGTVFVEQLSRYLVPMLAAGVAGWLASRGCHP
jgi:hypothetical protein